MYDVHIYLYKETVAKQIETQKKLDYIFAGGNPEQLIELMKINESHNIKDIIN